GPRRPRETIGVGGTCAYPGLRGQCRGRLEVRLEDGLGVGEGADAEELLAELAALGEALRVPAEVLPEFRLLIGLDFIERVRVASVLDEVADALGCVQLLRNRLPLEGRACLAEDPWQPVGTAGDHDPSAAGFRAHAPRGFAGPNVAVAD